MLENKMKDETTCKLLQINLYEDILSKMIKDKTVSMVQAGHIKPKDGEKLATLKVARTELCQ